MAAHTSSTADAVLHIGAQKYMAPNGFPPPLALFPDLFSKLLSSSLRLLKNMNGGLFAEWRGDVLAVVYHRYLF